jgi:hypothetical protein
MAVAQNGQATSPLPWARSGTSFPFFFEPDSALIGQTESRRRTQIPRSWHPFPKSVAPKLYKGVAAVLFALFASNNRI